MGQVLRGFIICRIGIDGYDDRERSELVKEHIIDKALRQVEEACQVQIRSEIDHHDTSPRDIFLGLVKKIIDYEFIFAVIFANDNQNIYYELGIAHSAGRDVHILMVNDKGRDIPLPFDTAHIKVIKINGADLNHRREQADSNTLGAATAEIAKSIIDSLRSPPKPRQAFSTDSIDPLGSQFSKYVLHERFSAALPYRNEKSVDFFADKRRIVMVGITLLQWTGIDEVWPREGENLRFTELLRILAVENSLDIDIVIMHEDNPAMPQMLASFARGEDDGGLDVQVVQREIRESTSAWQLFMEQAVADGARGRLRLLKLKKGVIYNRILMNDRTMMATPYFYHSKTNGTGPAIQANHDTSLYKLVTKDLEFLAQLPDTEVLTPQPHAQAG